jgi:hypothetical protein
LIFIKHFIPGHPRPSNYTSSFQQCHSIWICLGGLFCISNTSSQNLGQSYASLSPIVFILYLGRAKKGRISIFKFIKGANFNTSIIWFQQPESKSGAVRTGQRFNTNQSAAQFISLSNHLATVFRDECSCWEFDIN